MRNYWFLKLFSLKLNYRKSNLLNWAIILDWLFTFSDYGLDKVLMSGHGYQKLVECELYERHTSRRKSDPEENKERIYFKNCFNSKVLSIILSYCLTEYSLAKLSHWWALSLLISWFTNETIKKLLYQNCK